MRHWYYLQKMPVVSGKRPFEKKLNYCLYLKSLYIRPGQTYVPLQTQPSLMNNFGKLKDLVMSLEGDFEKFYDKNNSAAGTRVRKGMQELKNMAQQIRSEVQDIKNGSGSEEAAPKKAAPAAKKPAAPAKKK